MHGILGKSWNPIPPISLPQSTFKKCHDQMPGLDGPSMEPLQALIWSHAQVLTLGGTCRPPNSSLSERNLTSFSITWDVLSPNQVAFQAPLLMGLSKQEYWSGLPWPPPGDFPDLGIKPESLVSLALQVDSLLTEPPGKSFPNVFTKDKATWLQKTSASSCYKSPIQQGAGAQGLASWCSEGKYRENKD